MLETTEYIIVEGGKSWVIDEVNRLLKENHILCGAVEISGFFVAVLQ